MKTITMTDMQNIMAAAGASEGRVSLIGAGPGKRQYTVVCAFMESTAEERSQMTERVSSELNRQGVSFRRVEGQPAVLMVPMGGLNR